jgi:hypothetical protein
MNRKALGFGLTVCATAILAADLATAQDATDIQRGDTVLTRPRPELAPLGIRLGTFLAYPQLTISETYSDNIFATENDRESDFITTLSPDLSLESDWNNHALNFSTGLSKGFYADNTRQDFLDFYGQTDGRIDVTRNIGLTGGGSVARRHQDRADPNDQGGGDPTEFWDSNAFAGYEHRFGRFRTNVEGTFQRLAYEDVPASGGSGPVNNSDRDRNIYGGNGRLGYEILPEYEAFVAIEGDRRVYDRTPDDAGRSRDSSGVTPVAGVAYDFGGLLFGDVFAGWKTRWYDSSDEDNVNGPTFGGSLEWNATSLTTVTGVVAQEVMETTDRNASSYVSTTGSLAVDHELLRNLLLNVNGSITYNDYEGSSREDYVYRAGTGLRYLMNRWFYVSGGYRFTRRSSDNSGNSARGDDQDFTENAFLISLEGQF